MSRTRLIYILGASHSGTTLMAMLLNAHSEIVTGGELKAEYLGDPERYLCSCHAPIKRCRFWQQVNESCQDGFQIWNADTHFDAIDSAYVRRLTRPLVRNATWERARDIALSVSPRWRSGKRRFLSRSFSLIESIAQVAGVDVVVESSKIGLRLRYLCELSGLEVHVVRLIRDGRGVALTYTQPGEFADARSAAHRSGGTGAPPRAGLDMAAAAREWKRSNEEAEALLSQVQVASTTQIRYEDLCANALQSVNGVCTAVGLEPLATLGDFRSVEHHVIGNGMRLDTDSRIELDERWRDVLTPTDLSAFDAIAGPLNRHYGYV